VVNIWGCIGKSLFLKANDSCGTGEKTMTDKTASGTKKSLITRRGVLRAFAATTIVAAPTYANAAGFLRGAGDVRRLRMYSGRTGEHLDTIYWIEGKYIKDAVKEINYFMRDWREDASRNMDIRTFDIITAAAAASLAYLASS
jgi:uncharacterized protein YcbK (DUF882 family)